LHDRIGIQVDMAGRPVAGAPRERPSVSFDRPLKIVLVHAADFGGGAEASTLSLHKAYRELGHESFMYVGSKQSDQPHVTEIPRHRCFPGLLRGVQFLERRTGWQYLYHPWFRRLDRSFPPNVDVVHYHSLWGGAHGFADVGGLPRLTRRYPSLMTLRDMWMLTGHCGYPELRCERWLTGCGRCPDLGIAPAIPHDGTAFNWRRKRIAIARSDLRVLTVSRWLMDTVKRSPIFARKDIRAIHNGVDESVFTPRCRAEMRGRWGLPPDARIVLVAGQSVESAGGRYTGAADYALQAMRACGERLLRAWGRTGRAIPFQNEPAKLAELYSAADVVLVASLWETFGRIPAEAQMCGIPVAAFDTGGIPEVVADHETGLLAPREDGAALGLALRRILENAELRANLGAAAATRARAMFSQGSIALQHLEQYRDVMARRRPDVTQHA
jgi:glycosyltransferase involved in cell wall biosynthesis